MSNLTHHGGQRYWWISEGISNSLLRFINNWTVVTVLMFLTICFFAFGAHWAFLGPLGYFWVWVGSKKFIHIDNQLFFLSISLLWFFHLVSSSFGGWVVVIPSDCLNPITVLVVLLLMLWLLLGCDNYQNFFNLWYFFQHLVLMEKYSWPMVFPLFDLIRISWKWKCCWLFLPNSVQTLP